MWNLEAVGGEKVKPVNIRQGIYPSISSHLVLITTLKGSILVPILQVVILKFSH